MLDEGWIGGAGDDGEIADARGSRALIPRRPPSGRGNARTLDAPCRCPNCGTVVEPLATACVKRGAVTITGTPREVRWRGVPVGLSPLQAEMFAVVAMRGRASFEAIDEAMVRFGASIRTRSVHILRIRQKFAAVGANDPFERVGNAGFRFVMEADEERSTSTVIGARSHY